MRQAKRVRAATGSRVRPVSAARIPAKAASQRVLEQSLRVVLEHFAKRGLSAGSRRAALEAVLSGSRRPTRGREIPMMNSLEGDAKLLAAWHREPSYQDELGAPRALPLRGAVSLAALFTRFSPTNQPAAAVRRLEADGVIRPAQDGHWLPVRRVLVTPQLSSRTLERVPFLLYSLLSTLAHNGSRVGRSRSRLERTAWVDRLPARMLPQFDRYTRDIGSDAINRIDNWMMQRDLPPESPEPAGRAVVSIVVHVEPNSRARQRSKRPGARR